jgi:uncharacterized phage-associated protein
MPIRIDTAAKYLCEQAGWGLSNLPLQKLLFLAQVEFAQDNDGASLLDGSFQAWDYGPVIPELYRRLKVFGENPVSDVFYNARKLRDGSPSKVVLDRTWDEFGSASPGRLIELTHWNFGAWALNYEPGIRGIQIAQRHIFDEARNRQQFKQQWNSITQR